MSLTWYLEPQENMVKDVEKEFATLKLECTPENNKIIQEIEKGKLVDSVSFIDRFGYKLYTKELSTGCKAALCVLNRPDKIISLIEVGLNARDFIIKNLRKGNISLEYNEVTISGYDEEIDVQLENKRFTNLGELNDYLRGGQYNV